MCPVQVFLVTVQSFVMEKLLVLMLGMNYSPPVNPKFILKKVLFLNKDVIHLLRAIILPSAVRRLASISAQTVLGVFRGSSFAIVIRIAQMGAMRVLLLAKTRVTHSSHVSRRDGLCSGATMAVAY